MTHSDAHDAQRCTRRRFLAAGAAGAAAASAGCLGNVTTTSLGPPPLRASLVDESRYFRRVTATDQGFELFGPENRLTVALYPALASEAEWVVLVHEGVQQNVAAIPTGAGTVEIDFPDAVIDSGVTYLVAAADGETREYGREHVNGEVLERCEMVVWRD